MPIEGSNPRSERLIRHEPDDEADEADERIELRAEEEDEHAARRREEEVEEGAGDAADQRDAQPVQRVEQFTHREAAHGLAQRGEAVGLAPPLTYLGRRRSGGRSGGR